jgi:hypothetical protein
MIVRGCLAIALHAAFGIAVAGAAELDNARRAWCQAVLPDRNIIYSSLFTVTEQQGDAIFKSDASILVFGNVDGDRNLDHSAHSDIGQQWAAYLRMKGVNSAGGCYVDDVMSQRRFLANVSHDVTHTKFEWHPPGSTTITGDARRAWCQALPEDSGRPVIYSRLFSVSVAQGDAIEMKDLNILIFADSTIQKSFDPSKLSEIGQHWFEHLKKIGGYGVASCFVDDAMPLHVFLKNPNLKISPVPIDWSPPTPDSHR